MLIHCFTDNRNRTGATFASLLAKDGGSLGEPGSVAWMFEKKGTIVVDAGTYGEDDLFVAIDAGAEDINPEDEILRDRHRADRLSRGARGPRRGRREVRERRHRAAPEEPRRGRRQGRRQGVPR